MRAISFLFTLLLLATPFSAQEPSIDGFIRTFTDEWMRFHTDAAASSRYFKGPEQDAFERQIEPRTLAHRQAEFQLALKGLRQLRMFPAGKLTEKQQLSADIIAWDLTNRIEGEPFQDYNFPLVQTDGVQSALPAMLTTQHPVLTPRDAENYIARMEQLAPRMEEAIAEAQRLIGKKLVPPKFILKAAVAQIDGFLSTPAALNPLVATFVDRMAKVKDLPSPRQAELRAAAEKITADKVYPAWRKAKALLEGEIPKASEEAGLWRLEKGLDAYTFKLRQFTTTKMTAMEIHNTGLRLVGDIEARMDAILRKMGRTEGTVRVRMDKLRDDQPAFPATPEGRAAYRAEIEKTVSDAGKRAALLFERVPKTPVVVRPYPEFMGPRAQSYTRPAPDGSRPGTFNYPEYGVKLSMFGLRTIAYHEAIPGHHFQLALWMEDESLPRFQKDGVFGRNSANSEGWGLYAERVAAESGWYEGDPVGQLSQLDSSVFRARRLVVDTGMHAMRWSRQKAIDYLGPNPAGGAEAEIDRYVMRPGQACSYMIGELKIVELRERARTALGSKFSLREFHNVVLGIGGVPLEILDREINRWIETKKA